MTTAASDPSTPSTPYTRSTPYTFDNSAPTGGPMLTALGQMFDEFTAARLVKAGVRPGARCLEVGAGAGTVAVWMAEEAGPSGEVIATDVKPEHVPAHPGLTVLPHNVVTDPLPEGKFDVIHVRAVLQHLPQRQEVLPKLVDALAPGGSVVVEEIEARWGSTILATPDPRAYGIFERYETAMLTVLKSNGNDPAWARRVHQSMRDLGLTDVNSEGWQGSYEGGTGSCLLAHAGSTELRERLIEVGMPAEDLDVMATLTLDPRLVLRGTLLLSTSGRNSA